MADTIVPQAELLRIFAVQDQPRLMFFFGAGTSFGAGIPTASEVVWMLKRQIYLSDTGASPEAFRDLSSTRNRQHLQAYFESHGGYPVAGDDSEYSTYFERCYPNADHRRVFIRQILRNAAPTIGHECLAALLTQGRCNWVWTTNFDDLVERAERPDASRRLCHVGPESQERLSQLLAEGMLPILVKLHGDYRYDRLQNTENELQQLDADLRSHLLQVSPNAGMVVIGYSGRDESVMSAFEHARDNGGFRHGIYWCLREGEQPRQRVIDLVESIQQQTNHGGFVVIEGFDDILYRLYRQCELSDRGVEAKAKALFEIRKSFTSRKSSNSRTNAIILSGVKVQEYPSTLYRFSTTIHTWKELRDTIGEADIAAGLLKGHVLAIGNRERIRTVFQGKIQDDIQPYDIGAKDFIRSDSVVAGLFYHVIDSALVNTYGLCHAGRRTFYLPDLKLSGLSSTIQFKYYKQQFSVPMATPKDGAIACEAFSYQLECHEDDLWFVFEPKVVVTTDGKELAAKEQRTAISNAIMSARYNAQSFSTYIAWLYYLRTKSSPVAFVFPPDSETVFRLVLDVDFTNSLHR